MKKTAVWTAIILGLCGCGGSNPNVDTHAASPDAGVPIQGEPMAAHSDVTLTSTAPGVTPFISTVNLSGLGLASVQSVAYTIAPMPGSVSKPVHVSFSNSALTRRGYLSADASSLALPVFGLYAGYANNVRLALTFLDGSVQTLPLSITTAAYTDPNGVYDHPVIVKARSPGSALGFDFFVMKSNLGTPVIVDTDAVLRWVAQGVSSSISSILTANGFEIGNQSSLMTYRLELDGSLSTTALSSSSLLSFNHNLDPGPQGYLAEMATAANTGSTVTEFTPAAGFIQTWDFAQLLTNYMQSQGDDASAFVRPAADWFHANGAAYDPSDNSLIVSSRENFLMKVDYDTGAIIWILGDPTKYWYTFPSLRAKALQLTGNGLYPIGQHAPSILSNGQLMIINDGQGSLNQPAGEPAGQTRSYTAVSVYSIDAAAGTATQTWEFDYNQSLFSPICGSAYEAPAGASVLVDFATADNDTTARLVGVDANQNVIFDFQFPTGGCNSAWNAVPINLDNLLF